MDLDIGAVRAFVSTANLLHFGQAADELGISQQALSKRIRKLETNLAVTLFERTTRTVTLTPAGQRFLLPALEALNAADDAVAAVSGNFAPIRVDVLAEPLAPTLLVDQLSASKPSLVFERSARRGVAAAIAALLRGEIDLAFGRVYGTLTGSLAHCLIRSEPLLVLVPERHPLAAHDDVHPSDLSAYGIWTQAPSVAPEWSGFAREFAMQHGCRVEFAHVDDVNADYILGRCGDHGPAFLTATDVANTQDPRLRSIAITEPIAAYPWSLIWRSDETERGVREAVTALQALAEERNWRTESQQS